MSSLHPSLKVGIPPRTKLLRLEYCDVDNTWLVWIDANQSFEFGTFIKMYSNGHAERVTTYPSGHEKIMRIR